MKELRLTAKRLALLAASCSILALGCADDSSGNGGNGGTAGEGGTGGDGASTGTGGDAGTGGVSIPANAVEVCQAWCRNAQRGPSCCLGSFCLEGCYEVCEETVAEQNCPEEWTAARECDLEQACDDFFRECGPEQARLAGCELRRVAEQTDSCEEVAAFCEITEDECLDNFTDATNESCAFGWNDYVQCVGFGSQTCAECVTFSLPFNEEDCGWPESAATEVPFDPKSCDTLTLPPAGCGGACPGGTNPECGFGTFCSAGTCEAQCVSNTDCARGEACSVRGRCLPTVFGEPLDCGFFDDPPAGCGVECPTFEGCPEGTFCRSGVCDAECENDASCGAAEECGPNGLCQLIPFDECSAERTLDPSFARTDATVNCSVMGIPVPLQVVFTAEPTAELGAGSNTFDIQLEVGFNADVVDLLLALTNTVTFTNITADVVPTVGTMAPATEAVTTTPLPCDLSLQTGTPVGVVFPVRQATWTLDVGTTQELTIEDVTAEVNAAGLPLVLTTSGDDPNCDWAVGPPSLSFDVP